VWAFSAANTLKAPANLCLLFNSPQISHAKSLNSCTVLVVASLDCVFCGFYMETKSYVIVLSLIIKFGMECFGGLV
jgi:hypothetical protein